MNNTDNAAYEAFIDEMAYQLRRALAKDYREREQKRIRRAFKSCKFPRLKGYVKVNTLPASEIMNPPLNNNKREGSALDAWERDVEAECGVIRNRTVNPFKIGVF